MPLSQQLTFFDLQVKTVWQGQMPAVQPSMEVDLGEALNGGVYLLKATRYDGHFATQKLVVE